MKKVLGGLIVFSGVGFFLQTGQTVSLGMRDQASVIQSARPSSSLSAERNPSFRADLDFGRMPLYFIANRGQMDDRVAYYVQGRDKTLYFTPQGVTLVLTENKERLGDGTSSRVFHGKDAPFQNKNAGSITRAGNRGIEENVLLERWVVKLDFVGANPDARPEGLEKTEAVVSYFKGRPDEWRTGLPTYSKIIYRDLWPGIDLVYSGTLNRLKYEFIVHPAADPSLIQLAYRGASSVEVNAAGRLEVKTPAGEFEDDVPVAYQEVEGERVEVALSYVLGKVSEKESRVDVEEPVTRSFIYGFDVGDYDRTMPLVLDPAVLVYCGYIGGSGDDFGYAIEVDGEGNAYVTGETYSTESSFPVTVGPDLTHNGGSIDAFVAKVNASGTALSYCGYIGGSGGESGWSIKVDAAGNAYVTGNTSSLEDTFPVVIGPDLTHNGYLDAFVAKVNAFGTALIYCGYIGGSGDDSGSGIAIDSEGNVYISGDTSSTEDTFPVVIGPDLTHNGYLDAFVAKVNASGTGLIYCGYIGGSGSEYGCSIAVDSAGNACITGYTYSTEATFPVAIGPDLIYNGGDWDAFVAKVNASGTGLSYCGYIGGSGSDYGYGIAVDGTGNAYVTGGTFSTQATFPVAIGPDLTHNGWVDAFVAKVNATGTALVYCGYIGGLEVDYGRDIAVDSEGNAYVAGNTASTQSTFPVLIGPDLTHNGGVYDAFVAKVNASGTALIYCGYIGGSNSDVGYGIAIDNTGSAYVTGRTDSTQTSFPVIGGPDLTYNGEYDSFVAKIITWDLWTPRHAVGDFDGDGADEAAVDFGTTGIYLYDGGIWTQLSSANPESLVAAEVDGDSADEILADLGASGLWLWNGGAWGQLSGVNVEGMAAGDVDADGADEVVGDFGMVGMWLYDGGSWSQLSGVNADYIACANLDGGGGEEIVGDFGSTGMWIWNAGAWTQLSGVNADYVAFGNTDGLGGEELIGDFGPTGLWLWSQGGGWLQLSGVNADYMITGDADGNGDDEIFGDFGATGLWQWDSGVWTQLSGVNADFMIRADIDGNGDDEVIGDFGPIGLWLVNAGSWTQISGVNAEYMMAGDVDGDGADEILADFGSLGLWLWNGGAWSQISALNPE